MDNRFVSSAWSSRSGVLLGLGDNPGPTVDHPNDQARYKSPKGNNPAVPLLNGGMRNGESLELNHSMMNGLTDVNPLMDINLPAHMFRQAINFESIQQSDVNMDQLGDLDLEEEHVHNVSLNVADKQADILEQQQAMEQAKLMKRFKELRQWQLQQQEVLMLQQQNQLLALKNEQQRVQDMIVKQRQVQWGGKGSAHTTEPSPFVSPKKRTMGPVGGGIAQALAGGVVHRYKQVHGTTGRDIVKDHPKGHLPRPVLPDSDSDGGSYHGPELYSDVGSVDSHDGPDDRLCPLPPSDSETGMDSNGLQQRTSKYDQGEITVRISKSDIIELETDEGIGTHSFRSSPVLTQHEEDGEEDGLAVGNNNNSVIYIDQEDNHIDDRIIDHHENEDDELPGQDETGPKQMSSDKVDPDERPVSSALGGKKTFEELLEEHLRAEEEKSNSTAIPAAEKTPKRQFLRRGQGLARFLAPPKRKESLNSVRPAAPNTRTEPVRTVPVKKVTNTKGNNSDTSRSVNRAMSKTVSSTKTESYNPDASTKGTLKKSAVAPKHGQGVPGIAQKSLKLCLPVSTSVTEVQRDSKATCAKAGGMEKSNDRIKTSLQLARDDNEAVRGDVKNSGRDGLDRPVKIDNPATSQRESVDMSFLSRLEKRQENEHVEEEELEEFEMLEHFADNASFSSNSSLVVRVLQKDKAKATQYQPDVTSSGQLPYRQDNRQRFFKHPYRQADLETAEEEGNDDEQNETLEELSSSSDSSDSSDTEVEELISTVRTLAIQVEEGDNRQCDPGQPNVWTVKSRSGKDSSESSSDEDTRQFTQDRSKSPLKRKIAGRDDHNPMTKGTVTQVIRESVSFSGHGPGSTSHLNGVDNRHYREGEWSGEEDRVHSSRQNSQSANRNSNLSNENENCEQRTGDDFDDGEEWGETSIKRIKDRSHSSDGSEADDTIVEETKVKRSPAKSSVFPESSKRRGDVYDSGPPAVPSPPPTSKLVTKLFPKLRPPKPSPKEQEQKDRLQSANESAVGDGINSKILRDKLEELEVEINKFRTENSTLERLRREREEGLSKLKKEIAEFEKEKNEELQRLQEFKVQETKKLKHEKKVFEKYQKAARAMPDKKEREEIETLKSQLSDLQEELKRKESRWTSSTARLKSRVEDLEKENSELKEEIRLLEKKRLEWLQKEQAQKSSGGYFVKNDARLMNSTPSHNLLVINGSTNEYGFINTDSDEEMDPVKDDRRKLIGGKNNPTTKTEASRQVTKPEMPNQTQERPSSANHRTDRSSKSTNQKSSKSASSSNQKLEKSRSPPKPNHKSTLRGHPPKTVNVMRTSLTEDIPRRHFTAAATPQDVSMNGDAESELSNVAGQKQRSTARKMAARFNVDKSSIDKGGEYDEVQHPDGKLERIYGNGAREILFSNGTRKEISSDGQSIIVCFFNGDIKQIMSDQRVVYYYSEAQTTHTTYPDGLEVLQFPNNQVEKHYPDGTKEITFPDQTIKYLFPSGVEESIFTDGTVIRVEKTGDKTIEFPNGQREIHTEQFKKREYPDGTMKTVFPDGRQETRYANGRVRVKDREGNVIMDKRS